MAIRFIGGYQQQADQKTILIIYRHLRKIAAKNRGRTRHWLSTSTSEVIRRLSDWRRSHFGGGKKSREKPRPARCRRTNCTSRSRTSGCRCSRSGISPWIDGDFGPFFRVDRSNWSGAIGFGLQQTKTNRQWQEMEAATRRFNTEHKSSPSSAAYLPIISWVNAYVPAW